MIKPKYKVGDFLMPVMDMAGKTKLQVIEILTQICPANIEQVNYVCRVGHNAYRDEWSFIKDYWRFNEIEVMPYKAGKENT